MRCCDSFRWPSRHWPAVLMLSVSLLLISGCDKIPKAGELLGGKDSSEEGQGNAPATVSNNQNSTTQADNYENPGTNPGDPDPMDQAGSSGLTVVAFLKIEPYDRRDHHLEELANLKTGLDQLTELNLQSSQVTGKGLSYLPAFSQVKELNLSNIKTFGNSDLAHVGKLKNLEKLWLESTNINDAGLVYLEPLNKLQELSLMGTGITDNGFLSLKKLPVLVSINVSMTSIDGSGFKVFTGPRQGLKVIEAHHTNFGAWGFNHIANSKILERLILAEANVTDNNLRALKGCTQLKELDLAFNSVSSVGFQTLGGLTNMEELTLWNNQKVDDRALQFIKNYKKLKLLIVEGTGITQEALALLKSKYTPDVKFQK